MTAWLRQILPGTISTSASFTLPIRPAPRSGQACSFSKGRRGGSDSYLSEKSSEHPPFREHWAVPFCVSCACPGGTATLRDAVSAHQGCWGEPRRPGTPLIAGRCEHGPRHNARVGRSQPAGTERGPKRQASTTMRAGVFIGARRVRALGRHRLSPVLALAPAVRGARSQPLERAFRRLIFGHVSLDDL
jgi:hypothetical protein